MTTSPDPTAQVVAAAKDLLAEIGRSRFSARQKELDIEEAARKLRTALDAHQPPAALDDGQSAPLVMIRRDRAERLVRFARACDEFPGGFEHIDWWHPGSAISDDEAIEELRDAWDAITPSDLWMP
jgi:hypothetical protein